MQKMVAFDAEASLAHLQQEQEALASLDHVHEMVFEAGSGIKQSRAERRAAKPAFRGKCL